MASSRFVVVRGTAAFQENPRIPREEYPPRPTPFILSMWPTIMRISLRSWNARRDRSTTSRETNIFFACLITVGRYCEPSSLFHREERSRRRIATSRRRMHSDERCHAHDVRTVEEEWKNGGPRWKGGGEDARDGDVQLISKRRNFRGARLGVDLHARTISYTSLWPGSAINQRTALPQRPACTMPVILAHSTRRNTESTGHSLGRR